MPDWLDIVVRSLIFLVILFIITKIVGKKQLSQLSFFEYVSGFTIGSIGSEVIMNLDLKVMHGIIGIVIFGVMPFVAGYISLKSKKFRDVMEGKGTVFIKNGKVMEENLKKEKYTIDELMQLLRTKDVFQISDVEFAVLEANGELNVLLKKENQPLTAKDFGVKVPSFKEPQTVIMDGEILDEPLSTVGQNRNWLKTELEKLGVTIENVFLGQVDSFGQLSVDLFDDKLKVAEPVEKPLILATMKKCQADLELFALATNVEEAKQMYSKNSKKLDKAINKVTPLLRE
ncbi:DUF421 domain-containing protein [Alteribacillus bidgolensis]|uniref:Uncharacterized membrane protein YcaP, DUF421 family n=1 Tax=Alteribacillus bidgolensis TaxID=930129 RepID=A0A1G8CTP0_9BACI|nr:DUF421 domain-containing protein [Alteribacillus bidgolensis]SDH48643.1 Uncharacterized membrane protein YcaP, DUF421 family [Alteribacillus bidgolensis]